ncbi:hypothetical protein CAPI_07710 [Corynebacterium capitovis DSM 44611]|uniref:DUF2771 family protein n=1 Tax=Corynebacterium capitovis TaxID=131081 RepID=UPI000380C891|nr:DUF2771 family protein [Corynebacterium capitovis]WKD58078.1 hypothetical protein CAPI_07710 [Corynebacterium capitovis DSM 44611]
MATNASRTSAWKLLIVLGLGVLVLVAGLYAFWDWQKNKPGRPASEVTVAVTSGDATLDVGAYTVCELDAECEGGQPPSLALDTGSDVTVRVPEEIGESSWQLLTIYDDPAANDQQLFQAGDALEATAPATKGEAHLVVAEVSFLTVGTDTQGHETPVVATYSVSFNAPAN